MGICNEAHVCQGDWHTRCLVEVTPHAACRSQSLAELLDLPMDDVTTDPNTPKELQKTYSGVYFVQPAHHNEHKKSRFANREQVCPKNPVRCGSACSDLNINLEPVSSLHCPLS